MSVRAVHHYIDASPALFPNRPAPGVCEQLPSHQRPGIEHELPDLPNERITSPGQRATAANVSAADEHEMEAGTVKYRVVAEA